MSRLGELIRTLCPNGVEYKKLESLGTFYGGLTGKSKTDFDEGNAKFITYLNVYSNPSVNLNVDTFVKVAEGEKQNGIQYGDVLFTGSSETPDECGMSSVVTEKVNENIYLNSFCFGFRLNETRLFEPNFLKHLFRSRELRKVITQTASGVTRFNVSKKRFGKVEIPIPPIAIQKEIAGILDKFTALEAELEAELEARKKQYEHYRDTLLDFTPPVDEKTLTFKRLGDVCEIRSGWGFPNKEQGIKEGDFPFYKVGDMNLQGNEHFMMSANNYISRETAKRLGCNPAPKGTTIFPKIGAAIATNKKRVLTVSSCYDNNVVGIVPGNEVIPEFIFYLFDSIDLMTFSDFSGAVPSIRKTTLEKHLIPIPPIEEQERIVCILDKLEAICTDLCEGLPAEIEARRRQYEHYRDRLLSFKRI